MWSQFVLFILEFVALHGFWAHFERW